MIVIVSIFNATRYAAILAEYFYNVKNGLSIITSKISSNNLSNENRHWFFVVKKKCQFSGVFLFSLLRFFDKLFDIIIDDPFLTL